jgi:hypothetical protein
MYICIIFFTANINPPLGAPASTMVPSTLEEQAPPLLAKPTLLLSPFGKQLSNKTLHTSEKQTKHFNSLFVYIYIYVCENKKKKKATISR